MLVISDLFTSIRTSKNPTLRALLQSVIQYNTLPARAGVAERADWLHLIARVAGVYLTSKPPDPNRTQNRIRWDGIADLLDKVRTEAATHGVHLLAGPTDYRKIGGASHSYWLELLDPLHRPGFTLSPKFSGWLQDPQARALKQSFWSWIGVNFAALGVGNRMTGAEFNTDVAFHNECNGSGRFRVGFGQGGLLRDHTDDSLYDTSALSTMFSGQGWAIFVCSPTGELYAGSHVKGKLHHSSFLGGRPVLCAGELVVDQGRVLALSAKSGHYQPSPADMRRLLRAFPEIPRHALVRPNMLDDRSGRREVHFFRVRDFLDHGEQAVPVSRRQVLSELPVWAKQTSFMTEVGNKLPDRAERLQRVLGMAPPVARPAPRTLVGARG